MMADTPSVLAPRWGHDRRFRLERVVIDDPEIAGTFHGWILHADDRDARALTVSGVCPACLDDTDQTTPLTVLVADSSLTRVGLAGPSLADYRQAVSVLADDVTPGGARWPSRSASVPPADNRPYPVVVTCKCVRAHEDADAKGNFGCGASWMLRAIPQGATGIRVDVPGPDDLAHWKDLAALAAMNVDAVKTSREAVGKWQTALAAITTLVGVVAAVGGRDALAKIDRTWSVWITVGVFTALALAVLTILVGQIGSTGYLCSSRFRATGHSMSSRRIRSDRRLRRSADCLRSRQLHWRRSSSAPWCYGRSGGHRLEPSLAITSTSPFGRTQRAIQEHLPSCV
jgi:hypothetical protein